VLAIVLLRVNKNPATVYAYMLSIYAWEQWLQAKDVFFVNNASFINVTSGIVVLIAVLITWLRNKGIFVNINYISRMILLLYCYVFISCFWSPVLDVSLFNFKTAFPYIVLVVLVTPLVINSLNDIKSMLTFFIVFGSILLVLLLFFTEWDYRTIVLAGNKFNLKTNPLAIANFSGYVFIVSMLASNLTKLKYLKWFVAVLCLVIAVKTGSRGQFVFMVISVLLFTPMTKSKMRIGNMFPLIFGVCVLLAISYWAMTEFSGTDTRWSGDKMDSDFSNRLGAAFGLLGVWVKSPFTILFGLGSSASFSNQIFGFYVHIVPLEILGEEGLIGFFIYLLILYKLYKAVVRMSLLTKNDGDNRAVLATFSALVFFMLLLSLKQGSFLGSTYLFSLIVVLSRLESILVEYYKK